MRPRRPALFGERGRAARGLVGDAVLRVVEVDARGLHVQPFAAAGVARKQLAQMHATHVRAVILQCLPGRPFGDRSRSCRRRCRWSCHAPSEGPAVAPADPSILANRHTWWCERALLCAGHVQRLCDMPQCWRRLFPGRSEKRECPGPHTARVRGSPAPAVDGGGDRFGAHHNHDGMRARIVTKRDCLGIHRCAVQPRAANAAGLLFWILHFNQVSSCPRTSSRSKSPATSPECTDPP